MTGDAGAGTPDEGETVHEMNARLRYEWLAATLAWTTALKAGQDEVADFANSERQRIEAEFFTRNRPLAMSAAKEFLTYARGDLSYDYEQAAMMGLWEAFVGTDPTKVNEVIVADDGTLRGAAGWDPTRSTFGGYSRVYVKGSVQRAVANNESGLSYAMWTNRPKVLAAKAALVTKLGREPSVDEVARHAGLPKDSVRAVLTPPSVSTETPLGDGFTLADTLAEVADTLSVEEAEFLSDWFLITVRTKDPSYGIKLTDAFAVVLRMDRDWLPALKVADAGARLGVGRGTISAAVARAQKSMAKAIDHEPSLAHMTGVAMEDRIKMAAHMTANSPA